MSTLEEVKASIIDEFSMFDEWLDKYEYLIEMGKNLDVFPVELKTDDRLIKAASQEFGWIPGSKMESCFSEPTAMPSLRRASYPF